MTDSNLHVDKTGTLGKPKTQSPKTIQAWANARESFTRTVIGGVVLALLVIAYGMALVWKPEHGNGILVVIGSGLGFLLGGREKSGGEG
jgi:hypothetical protein